MLNRLLPFLLDVCLLRRGPEDAPQQPRAAAIAVLANFMLLVWLYARDGASFPLLPAIQVTAVPLLVIWMILAARGLDARYPQTVFTLFAVSFLLNLVMTLSLQPLRNVPDGADPSLLTLLPLAVWIWSFVVDAHIYRRTLEAPFAVGILLAVLLFAANSLLLDLWYAPAVENSP